MLTSSRSTAEFDQLGIAFAAQADLDLCALGAAQLLDGLVAGPALGVLPFDTGDHVAAADALLVGRRPFEERHDGDVAVDRRDADAEAVVAAFLALAHLGVGAGVEEARVRVERLEHAGDGAVDEAVGFDVLDVLLLHGGQRGGEDAIAIGQAVGGGLCATAEHAPDERGDGDGEQDRRQRAVFLHVCSVPRRSGSTNPPVTNRASVIDPSLAAFL